jgi:hypothetical protein
VKLAFLAIVISLIVASPPTRAFACTGDGLEQYRLADAVVVAQVISIVPPVQANTSGTVKLEADKRFTLTIHVLRYLKGGGLDTIALDVYGESSCSPLRGDPTSQYFVASLLPDPAGSLR